ncbi:MAG: hypothetical protein H6540_00570 [Bacteroidales bacterium]|nr:hypothetical protein [Bacteroidales bacterium]MCB9013949.1 hypothetical protein [Bacteroidales bacterium]
MKTILSILLLFVPVFAIMAQDDAALADPAFEAPMLIDNPTVVNPYKGGLEFVIQHRFGTVKNGITDIFGIYAPSNIRMGFRYGISDKLMIGVGSTKDYKLQDVNWKYSLLQQTASGKMPVSLSYYGNVVLDARANDAFGPSEQYRDIHRFSYFTELIVARRFNDKFSFQVAPGFFYVNAVEEGLKNANFSIHAGGRAKIIGYNSLVFEYDQLLTKQDIATQPKPNLSLGYEIGTGTHAFQVFVANYSGLIGQRNLLYNTNDFSKGEFLVGFNITVRF